MDAPGENGVTALMTAARFGRAEAVRLLLDACVDGRALTQRMQPRSPPRRAWHRACSRCCSVRGRPRLPDTAGFCALHCAAQNGHTESVRVLLQAGAPIHALEAGRYWYRCHGGRRPWRRQARGRCGRRGRWGSTAFHPRRSTATRRRRVCCSTPAPIRVPQGQRLHGSWARATTALVRWWDTCSARRGVGRCARRERPRGAAAREPCGPRRHRAAAPVRRSRRPRQARAGRWRGRPSSVRAGRADESRELLADGAAVDEMKDGTASPR